MADPEQEVKFDKELSARNAAYGAIIGYLINKDIGLPLGLILGPLLDAIIYRIKLWVKGSK